MQISAVIITKNAESTLNLCLESVWKVADEVVLLDSGSTDGTINIAKRYRCRIVSTVWLGYGKTKNKGHELASSPFILSIDSDEQLSIALIQEINHHKNNLSGVYSFKRLNNYCGHWVRYGIWNPDKKIRLYPKSLKWNDSASHEKLVLPPEIKTHSFSGNLLHYAYRNKTELASKTRLYAKLGATDLKRRGKLYLFFKMLLSPAFSFTKSYVLKLGFLDGSAGFIISYYAALGSFLKFKMALLKQENI